MVSVVLTLAGVDVTIVTTPAVALALREAFACALNFPMAQVLLNSTFNGSAYAYYPSDSALNVLVSEEGACGGRSGGGNPARRLRAALAAAVAEAAAAAADSHRLLTADSPPAGGVDVSMLLVVTPPPLPASPSPGASPTSRASAGAGDVATQQFAVASTLYTQLNGLVTDLAANGAAGGASPNALVQSMAGFAAAVGGLLNVTPAV